MTRRSRLGPLCLGAATAGILAFAIPAVAIAHPLGNFTVNVYVGLRVSPSEIRIDAVVDQAEIPTFQERLLIDTDGDGEVSDAEAQAARQPECAAIAPGLSLVVGDAAVPLRLTATGLSFPPGAGGLSTMRIVCEFVAPLRTPIAASTTVRFTNRVHVDRLGWREITLEPDGTTIAQSGPLIPVESATSRLTNYPAKLLTQPFTQNEAAFSVTPGGPTLPPPAIPDAVPLPGEPVPSAVAAAPSGTAAGSVPGGVGAEIPAVFQATNLTPAVALLALATALLLGAGHALTPGHGKTLMAAYLVGTRGTPAHAAGLGLSVTVSHTIGILALAVLVIAAQAALPPDVVVRWLPAIAALTIVAIGGWMVVTEVRRRNRVADQWHDHASGHDHHDDASRPHSHDGVTHSHLPRTTITWRSLFILGLAGGIIPSTSALLILLGTIAAGRAVFGVVLVVAFGLGMAVVMSGVGLAMIYARGRLDRLPSASRLGRIPGLAPLGAGLVVFALGLWLTAQAVAGRPAL